MSSYSSIPPHPFPALRSGLKLGGPAPIRCASLDASPSGAVVGTSRARVRADQLGPSPNMHPNRASAAGEIGRGGHAAPREADVLMASAYVLHRCISTDICQVLLVQSGSDFRPRASKILGTLLPAFGVARRDLPRPPSDSASRMAREVNTPCNSRPARGVPSAHTLQSLELGTPLIQRRAWASP